MKKTATSTMIKILEGEGGEFHQTLDDLERAKGKDHAFGAWVMVGLIQMRESVTSNDPTFSKEHRLELFNSIAEQIVLSFCHKYEVEVEEMLSDVDKLDEHLEDLAHNFFDKKGKPNEG
jgi:hypothetical protein